MKYIKKGSNANSQVYDALYGYDVRTIATSLLFCFEPRSLLFNEDYYQNRERKYNIPSLRDRFQRVFNPPMNRYNVPFQMPQRIFSRDLHLRSIRISYHFWLNVDEDFSHRM